MRRWIVRLRPYTGSVLSCDRLQVAGGDRTMRACERARRRLLAELATMVAPGVTTLDLDGAAEKLVRAGGAEPAFKGYRGYPCTLCASVNEQVVHGIPSARALVEGDIISLDMGVKLNGFYGDSAITVPVGRVSEEAATLLRVTQESLEKGIAEVGWAAHLGHGHPVSGRRFKWAGVCASSWSRHRLGTP